MGRKIARTMHYKGAGWLTRSSREKEENTTLMLKALELKEGQVIADIGAGSGYLSVKMATAVGPRGKIYANEIQAPYLDMLHTAAENAGVKNIQPVLGTLIDPKLPEESCDLIIMVDVYHEFSHPEYMLTAIRKALKPGGRLALVEFRAEDKELAIKPDHKMSKKQILKELYANHFKVIRQFDELPRQHLMFFAPQAAADTKKESQG